MKIYTKTGDKGTTGLLGGNRVSKDDNRLEAYGTVDELNSWIGMIRSCPDNADTNITDLIYIQRSLFTICSHLASDNQNAIAELPVLPKITNEHFEYLEIAIDRMNENLPELKYFIMPGGSQFIASCHIARTVCRRAERRIISLSKTTTIDENIIIFINRLSDYLFVLARYCSYKQNVNEILWNNAL